MSLTQRAIPQAPSIEREHQEGRRERSLCARPTVPECRPARCRRVPLSARRRRLPGYGNARTRSVVFDTLASRIAGESAADCAGEAV